jgi:hypothetical protein
MAKKIICKWCGGFTTKLTRSNIPPNPKVCTLCWYQGLPASRLNSHVGFSVLTSKIKMDSKPIAVTSK